MKLYNKSNLKFYRPKFILRGSYMVAYVIMNLLYCLWEYASTEKYLKLSKKDYEKAGINKSSNDQHVNYNTK